MFIFNVLKFKMVNFLTVKIILGVGAREGITAGLLGVEQ